MSLYSYTQVKQNHFHFTSHLKLSKFYHWGEEMCCSSSRMEWHEWDSWEMPFEAGYSYTHLMGPLENWHLMKFTQHTNQPRPAHTLLAHSPQPILCYVDTGAQVLCVHTGMPLWKGESIRICCCGIVDFFAKRVQPFCCSSVLKQGGQHVVEPGGGKRNHSSFTQV